MVLVSRLPPRRLPLHRGNYHARRRWSVFPKLLEAVGIEPQRLTFTWVSASEARKWADVVGDVTERVRAIGPLGRFAGMSPAATDADGKSDA